MILPINRTKPFDPTTFIGAGSTIWRGPADGSGREGDEQQDARSLNLKEVDFIKAARFETCLKGDETVITGETRLARLREREEEFIRADAKIGQALYEEPGHRTLHWLHEVHGVTWFDLPGTELRLPSGGRYFLSLYHEGDGQWLWSYDWLGRARNAAYPALVLANLALEA